MSTITYKKNEAYKKKKEFTNTENKKTNGQLYIKREKFCTAPTGDTMQITTIR